VGSSVFHVGGCPLHLRMQGGVEWVKGSPIQKLYDGLNELDDCLDKRNPRDHTTPFHGAEGITKKIRECILFGLQK
jgi:hypothetical protein